MAAAERFSYYGRFDAGGGSNARPELAPAGEQAARPSGRPQLGDLVQLPALRAGLPKAGDAGTVAEDDGSDRVLLRVKLGGAQDCDGGPARTTATAPAGRLRKELEALRSRSGEEGIVLDSAEDLGSWTVCLLGAAGTVYEGERFTLRFTFPCRYPYESPEVVFVGPPPAHPHVYSNGHICLNILYDLWSPVLSVHAVCLSILSMLSSCTEKARPEDDATYVARVGHRSPKLSQWEYHDDAV